MGRKRMTRRGWLAAGVLLVWSATIGWHIKRLYLRPIAEIVIEAARAIPPGPAYYVVEQSGRRVGWSVSEVDTLPANGGFRVRERLEARISAAGQTIRTSVDSEAELGPALELRRFSAESRGLLGELAVRGEALADSMLRLTLTREGDAQTFSLPLDGPVILSGAWTLRFVANRDLRPGTTVRLPLFDPFTMSTRATDLEIVAKETRTYPDSATDAGPLWVTAREDTVQAWLVAREVAGLELRSWVDEDGRLLESEMPGRFVLRRTAFEFAFYGDSVPGWTPEHQNGGAPPGDPSVGRDDP